MKIYKHSDRFKGGIADMHITLPFGVSAWIEVKYMDKCVKQRKAGVTELQVEFLKEHAANNVGAYVLVGVGKMTAWYHIDDFDGNVYAQDLTVDADVQRMIYNLEGTYGNQ